MRSFRRTRALAVALVLVLVSSGSAFALPTRERPSRPTIGVRERLTAPDVEAAAEAAPADKPVPMTTQAGGVAATAATVARVSGNNRYGTAVAASKYSFTATDTAIVVSGVQAQDAAIAAGLAGVYAAPVLATHPTGTSYELRDELVRLGVTHVILIGDATIISDAVKVEIEAISTAPTVERLGGATLEGRAAAIADRMHTVLGAAMPTRCFLVDSWEAATIVAPIAYAQHFPVLPVTNTAGTATLSGVTTNVIDTLDITDAFVVWGGPFSSLDDITLPLGWLTLDLVQRRSAMALSAAFAFHADVAGWVDWSAVGIASAANPADAIGAGSMIGRSGGAVLLTDATWLAYCDDALLYDHAADIAAVWLFGGSAALGGAVLDAANDWSQPLPVAPAQTVASAGNRLNFLAWTEATDVELVGYAVYKSTSPFGPFAQVAAPDSPWYVDDSVMNGMTYYYQVAMIDERRSLEGPRGAVSSAMPRSADALRISGDNRYSTAIEISYWNFSEARTAVIATGENFPDALSASGLCGIYDAPLLLTPKNSLPAGLVTELDRLGVNDVILVGGTTAISPAVQTALVGAGFSVDRIAGDNRYETSAMIGRRVLDAGYSRDVFIARGDAFADALAVSPWAFWYRTPVVLVQPTAVPTVTRDLLNAYEIDMAVIVGGDQAVSNAVMASIPAGVSGRLAGTNRYATAAKLASELSDPGMDPSVVGVATGLTFADALGGGVACGYWGSPLLLTAPTGLVPEARNLIAGMKTTVQEAQVYGGSKALPDTVLASIHSLLQ